MVDDGFFVTLVEDNCLVSVAFFYKVGYFNVYCNCY